MSKKLIIKADEFTIYQIRPEYVQELKHIPEQDIKGFEHLINFKSTETYTPVYHQKEEASFRFCDCNRVCGSSLGGL